MKNRLYFFYGVMGSAKTTQLLTTNFSIQKNTNTILLAPQIDTRRPPEKVESRVGISWPCTNFTKDTNLRELCSENFKKTQASVILVDEAQFLTKEQVDQLAVLVDKHYFAVLCYGLKSNFKGELFEGSKRLLEMADKIEEIKTNCACGKKATINARLINKKIVYEGPEVLIGDIGGDVVSYAAMCRGCWAKS